MNAIQTRRGLDFEMAEPTIYELALADEAGPFRHFRVGTLGGQFRETENAYEILSLHNTEPGNGHFGDALEWFAYACRRAGKPLRIVHTMNPCLARHLVEKRGFKPDGMTDGAPDFIKHFGPIYTL